MRKWPIMCLPLLLLSETAVTAEDTDYGWCETRDAAGTYQMSGLMQKPESVPSSSIEDAFRAFLGSMESVQCWFYYSRPTEGEDYFEKRQYVIETEEKKRFALTGWTGPYGVTGKAPAKPSGATLTIKGAEDPAQAAEQSARQILDAQRQAADASAKAAANAARANSEYQEKLSEFFAELRRRGRAQ